MKVFISWSGQLSHKIALILRDWLPSVIQTVEPFLSTEDIDKGSLWFGELTKELETTKFGVTCLTTKNLTAPWILFEAGALSKAIDSSRVCTLLIGLSPSAVQGPLAQFQATLPNKEDMRKLVKSMNTALADKALNESKLDKAFEKWWDEFKEKTSEAMTQLPEPPDASTKRSTEDILEEVLTLCRSMAQVTSRNLLAEDVVAAAQRAFDSMWTANPMNTPLERLRETPGSPWSKEYEKVTPKKRTSPKPPR
jgi:hypothetical protein